MTKIERTTYDVAKMSVTKYYVYEVTQQEYDTMIRICHDMPYGPHEDCETCDSDASSCCGCEKVINNEKRYKKEIKDAGLEEICEMYFDMNRAKREANYFEEKMEEAEIKVRQLNHQLRMIRIEKE